MVTKTWFRGDFRVWVTKTGLGVFDWLFKRSGDSSCMPNCMYKRACFCTWALTLSISYTVVMWMQPIQKLDDAIPVHMRPGEIVTPCLMFKTPGVGCNRVVSVSETLEDLQLAHVRNADVELRLTTVCPSLPDPGHVAAACDAIWTWNVSRGKDHGARGASDPADMEAAQPKA